jgi:hypothetical protein
MFFFTSSNHLWRSNAESLAFRQPAVGFTAIPCSS